MGTQEIKLQNGLEVIIGYHTKRKCEVCKKEIFTAFRTNKMIKVELVGLAQWDIHKCTGDGVKF